MTDKCLFCEISNNRVLAKKVYEDDDFVAFNDINPIASLHILLIPRKHIISMQHVTKKDEVWLGRMMVLIPKIAEQNGCIKGLEGGFRIINNSGAIARQEILHLHFHIISSFSPLNK